MRSPYLVLVRAAQAELTLTVRGTTTAFKIAAPSKRLVEEELARLLQRLTERRATYMVMGPVFWYPDFIVFGEIHEAKGEKG
jgi:hypothetical protein